MAATLRCSRCDEPVEDHEVLTHRCQPLAAVQATTAADRILRGPR